jgi:hypothetical protein
MPRQSKLNSIVCGDALPDCSVVLALFSTAPPSESKMEFTIRRLIPDAVQKHRGIHIL